MGLEAIMAKVLIVMATKNRAGQLRKAIGDVVRQSERDWRLIIINDHSNDDTSIVIDAYKSLYPSKIESVENPDNFAVTIHGIMLNSQEDFLAQLDDDDRWNDEYLETMISVLEKRPQACEAYCDYWLVNEKGKRRYYDSSKNKPFPDTLPSLSVFRGTIFRQMRGWDLDTFRIGKSYIHCEADFYIRAKIVSDVIHVPIALVDIHKSSTSMSANRHLNVEGMKRLMLKWSDLLSQDNKVWAQYLARLGVHMIEDGDREGIAFLKDAVDNDKWLLEAWGGIVLASIDTKLFLWCYKIYRSLCNR